MSNFKKPTMIRIMNSLSIDMIKIPNKDYEMGKYPVTIAEYMHFAKEHKEHLPKWLKEGDNYNIETGTDAYYKKMNLTDNAPIIGVSWHDATAYCAWLSEKTKDTYRLPKEKEWEYACRAETDTKWSFGDDAKALGDYAWYDKNSESKTHPVGELKPNPWGLYDMYGNVWEWCEDWYDEEQKYKVLRGGSWYSDTNRTRSSDRGRNNPTNSVDNVGFRLLRTLP